MPIWLKPTAAFGVGLQSIFFVSDSFEVETSYPGEKSKRIIFRSAAKNQYCSIIQQDIKRKRGTTVKVDIEKERIRDLFGGNFGFDVLDSVVPFDDNGDTISIAKIDK